MLTPEGSALVRDTEDWLRELRNLKRSALSRRDVVQAGLGKNGRDVVLDGPLGQRQRLGDLAVGRAAAELTQHVELAGGQRLCSRVQLGSIGRRSGQYA